MWEPDAADMDVDAIWTSMTRQAKKNVCYRVLFFSL